MLGTHCRSLACPSCCLGCWDIQHGICTTGLSFYQLLLILLLITNYKNELLTTRSLRHNGAASRLSSCVHMGFIQVLQFSPIFRKIPVDRLTTVNCPQVWMSMLMWVYGPIQGIFPPHTRSPWGRLQIHYDSDQDKTLGEDEQMNYCRVLGMSYYICVMQMRSSD